MKKIIKTILFLLLIVFCVIFLDSAQALIFNNSPFLKIRQYYKGGALDYKDSGLLIDTYCNIDGEKDAVIKGFKFSFSDETDNNLLNKNVELFGADAQETFNIILSYANWTGDDKIYLEALNRDLAQNNRGEHLPIYKFDSLKQLEQFKLEFGRILTMDMDYGDVPSFNDVTANYDAKFFSDKTLILVYVSANSGSYRFGANRVFCDGKSFCIDIEKTNSPETGTCDMAGWFITAEVPKDLIGSCTDFSAVFENKE